MLLQWWSSSTAIIPLPSSQKWLLTPYQSIRIRRKLNASSNFRFTTPRAGFFEEFSQLTHNRVLVAAGLSVAIGQLSKPFTSVLLYGQEFDIKTIFGSGGFPSSHSAAVVATATTLGLERGLSDSIFGLTVVYAGLVMYDSQGVRREVGNHAKVLNKVLFTTTQVNSSIPHKDRDYPVTSQPKKEILERIATTPLFSEEEGTSTSIAIKLGNEKEKTISSSTFSTDIEEEFKRTIRVDSPLKESIGHTEVEVIAGALLGFIVGITLHST